jgi:hypothetical protein
MVNVTTDIKINGIVVWDDIEVSLSMGNTYYIDPNENDTENHFGNQQVYGIITRLIS